MSNTGSPPPPYTNTASPSAPPSYSEAVGDVRPSSTFTLPIQTARMITVGPIGRKPVICPNCHALIEMASLTEPGMLALCGYWLGCCFDECKNIDHSCPHCNSYFGRYTSSAVQSGRQTRVAFR